MSMSFKTFSVEPFIYSPPAFVPNFFIQYTLFCALPRHCYLCLFIMQSISAKLHFFFLVLFSMGWSLLLIFLNLFVLFGVSFVILSIVSVFNTIHIFLLRIRVIQHYVVFQFLWCLGLHQSSEFQSNLLISVRMSLPRSKRVYVLNVYRYFLLFLFLIRDVSQSIYVMGVPHSGPMESFLPAFITIS